MSSLFEARANTANHLVSRDLSGTRLEQDHTYDGPMFLAMPMKSPEALFFDLDSTLYRNAAYRQDVAAREMEAVGTALGWSVEETPNRIREHRENLGIRLGRQGPARLTETILDLGLTREWWDTTRAAIYRPEEFLQHDPRIQATFSDILSHGKKIAIASNTPTDVVVRTLRTLGVNEDMLGKVGIFGPDRLGVSKPDPEFFQNGARALGVDPEACLSIGDDEENDGYPAIEAGMGAAIVGGIDHLQEAVRKVLDENSYRQINLSTLAKSLYEPGNVKIVGLTGRAGAGKTTTAGKLVETCNQLGIPANILSLDAFFILSSKDRRAWLEEGKQLGEDEYAERADQASWWDFDKMRQALQQLQEGQSLHMTGVYNRADKGELTGEITIEPNPQGCVIVVEGVAIAHMRDFMDRLIYVNTHPLVRRQRLLGRDQHRAADAAIERFLLTQGFENYYFEKYGGQIDAVVDNTDGALLTLPAFSKR